MIFLSFIFKWVLLCSFTKSWFCFGGVLEHALMLGGSKIALVFTQFTLLQYLSPQPDTNGSISSGIDEGLPSEKQNVLWLVSCPCALWLVNSLDGVSVLPRPLPEQQIVNIATSIQIPRILNKRIEQEPLHARILQETELSSLTHSPLDTLFNQFTRSHATPCISHAETE